MRRLLLVGVLALAPGVALAAGSAQVVTLTAFPAVAPGFDPVVLSGAIEPAQAGELGTTLRAVLPAAQARPCYLAGYSKLVRT